MQIHEPNALLSAQVSIKYNGYTTGHTGYRGSATPPLTYVTSPNTPDTLLEAINRFDVHRFKCFQVIIVHCNGKT
jgi:hypothetical protein